MSPVNFLNNGPSRKGMILEMATGQISRQAVRSVTVRRGGQRLDCDLVVVEEPLEIRLNDKPLVVTMRTPGHDQELAAGFLHAEGMISTGSDITSMRVIPGKAISSSRIKVTNFSGDRVEMSSEVDTTPSVSTSSERTFRATAACGVCGKETIAELEQALPSVKSVQCPPQLFESLPQSLRKAQELFDATGGIHAAGIFSLTGDLLCLREDIGRHNAVDKVIGYFVLQNAVPLHDRILVVSGRAGFELVQKALMASVPAMVSVGAASSVAVEMATSAGMTLYSFAGRGTGNLHIPEPHRPEN